MSDINKLLVKPTMCKIGELEVEIFPLKMKDFDLFKDLRSEDVNVREMGVIKLIKKTLEYTFPNATEEQINNFDYNNYLEDLINAIKKVNDIKDEIKIEGDSKKE